MILARRSNKSRTGTSMGSKVPSVSSPMMENNTGFTTPTEFVELPSQGLLYPEGHPLHNKEEVEIRFMTAKDEDILSSQVLLKKGIMLDRFIQNILVDKSIDPQDLYSGDRNAILISARITGYGADYKVNVTCPSCTRTTDYEFDLSEYGVDYADNHEELDLTITPNGTYLLETPRTKVQLEIRLLSGKTEKYLTDLSESKRKNNILETPLTDTLKMIIVSVSGNADRNHIETYVNNMPAYDSRHVRKIYSQITPNIDLTKNFICPNCDIETQLEVPLTSDFFWPKL